MHQTPNKMETITKKEEEVLQILWKLDKAFVKEILAEFTDPKPHYNTISTVIRNMEQKGIVSHQAFGNTHQYFPVLSMVEYRKTYMQKAIHNYFESSYKNMVSFFAKEGKLSVKELKDIIREIEKK